MTVRLLFLAVGCVLAAGEAEAKSRAVFADAPGREVSSRMPEGNGSGRHRADIRGRRVKIDSSSIRGADPREGADSLGLNLFPDVDLTAVKQRFERRGARRSTWIGKVTDDPASSVIIVERDGLVGGSVFAHGKHYAIRGKDADSQEVVEVDQSAFPPEACDQPPAVDQAPGPAAPSPPPEAQADAAPTIDVMVVYTPAALARRGSTAAMNLLIDNAIAETNVSYANSGISTRLNLVHTAEVDYTETKASTGYSTDLTRLRNLDGHMDEVHSLRDAYQADVVVLLVDALSNYNTCGYAYIAAPESYAFALVDQQCATITYTFGHEIGHIQGARHDRYVDPSSEPAEYHYNHGDVDLATHQRTIMAYETECKDKLHDPNDPPDPNYNKCTRLPFWSKPTLNYPPTAYYPFSNRPMGSVDHENNALVLNNTAATVANFRQGTVSLTVLSSYPAAGVQITVSPPDANALSDGSTAFTRRYARGTTVTLTAPATEPVNGNPLLAPGWSGCTSESGAVCTVTLDGDKTVTANYYTPNRLPTFELDRDSATIPEDADPQAVLLTGISAGEGESDQEPYLQWTVEISSDPPGLIQNAEVSYPGSGPTGSLSFTTAKDASGTATIAVTVDDQQGAYHTAVRSLRVTVLPVNDAPSFVVGEGDREIAVLEDAGAQAQPWAKSVSAGPDNESAQTLSFTATNDNNPLFSVQPAVAADGTLTFTPASHANGSATVAVRLRDSGGTANGGVSTSATQEFTITVAPVNDAPSFVKGGNRTVPEDAGAQTAVGWATGIKAGPFNEGAQTLSFTTTNDNTPLFSAQPAVAANGTLTFTPASNASGSATVTVWLRDSGGTASGGMDAGAPQEFTITVSPVNDRPTLAPILPPSGVMAVTRNAGPQAVDLAVTAGGGEAQTLKVTASSSNTALVPGDPAHLGVICANPSEECRLVVAPSANKYGSATITVRVSDGQATNSTVVRSFRVVVNDPPTLDAIDPVAISEDAGLQTVFLGGIAAAADRGERQTLTVTATAVSVPPGLIPKPAVSYSSPNATGSLRFTPAANASGAATITVTVSDGQAANGTVVRSFPVTVGAVNDAPTLNRVADRTISEDTGPHTVALSGITAGGGEAQDLEVTASSDNPGLILILNPTEIYPGSGSTGSLRFTPVKDASGAAKITVRVGESGEPGSFVERSFRVAVKAVNDPPTLLAPFADEPSGLSIDEDAAEQTVALAGITAGGGAGEMTQKLTVTASSSNTSLIPKPVVSYTSPGDQGSLRFTPAANASGKAKITVKVSDGQSVNSSVVRSFDVTVNPVNDAPALNSLADRVLRKNAGRQTVGLSGITAGPKESQKLTVTARSSNTALIPEDPAHLKVSYAGGSTGSLGFTAAPNAYGEATITVTVNDGQGANNAFERSFKVTVNDPPTLAAIPSRTIDEDAPEQTVFLEGVTAGAGETQTLLVTARSSNTALIPDPGVHFDTPSGKWSLSFAPAADKYGSATITVTVNDGQAGNNTFRRTFLVTVRAVDDPPAVGAGPGADAALPPSGGSYLQTARTSRELQAALDLAGANGLNDIIRLAGGVFALSDNGSAHFTYSSTEERDLVIEGGWAPDFNRRAADITTELLNDVPTAEAGAGGVLEIVASGDVAVDGLVLSGGQAAGNGGGLFIAATGPIVVGNCQVLGNAAGGEGGGVFLESSGSSVLLHGSSIRGNSAAGGGGVLIRAASAVTVDANEIAGNAAVVADGGLQASVASGGELLVVDNTITGNRSAAGASGLTLAAWGAEGVSSLRVHDNRVYGNATAPSLVVAADCDYIANHLDLDIVNNVIESYGLCADYQLDGSNTGADPAR